MPEINEEKTTFGIVSYNPGELKEWDSAMEKTISTLKQSRVEAEAFARDAVQCLCITEQNMSTLQNQNILGRIWGTITGGNSRLRDDSTHNLAKAQHNTLKLLNKLGEQDVLLMHTIIAVTNYAKYIHTENTRLREILITNFNVIKEKIKKHDEEIENIKTIIEVIQWGQTASVKGYDELEKPLRLFKMIYDFSKLKVESGYWRTNSLDCFKSALLGCGFSKDESISIKDLIHKMIKLLSEEKTQEIRKWLSLDKTKTSEDFVILPLLYSLDETTHIFMETWKYKIIPNLIEKAKKEGVELDAKECLYDISIDYLKANGIDTDTELKIFDLAVDILQGKNLIETLDNPVKLSSKKEKKGHETTSKASSGERGEKPSSKPIDKKKITIGDLSKGLRDFITSSERDDCSSATKRSREKLLQNPGDLNTWFALGKCYIAGRQKDQAAEPLVNALLKFGMVEVAKKINEAAKKAWGYGAIDDDEADWDWYKSTQKERPYAKLMNKKS
ncbi:MAG: hypothetical protein WC614_04540 [bacterium]